jgi:hypothetical protein
MSIRRRAGRPSDGSAIASRREDAMKYLCLVYQKESELDAMPRSELDALIAEHLAYDDSLRDSGHFIVAEALERTATATTLRVRGGKVSMTDGPFAETKEQLTGFFLLRARDLNEALQLASRIPSARLGCIEVRAVDPLTKNQ